MKSSLDYEWNEVQKYFCEFYNNRLKMPKSFLLMSGILFVLFSSPLSWSCCDPGSISD